MKKQKELRLTIGYHPVALIPGFGDEGVGRELMSFLFEGLMQRGLAHTIEPALAHTVEISKDLKTYTFHLRESFWSNGTLLHAEDFEYAWKKILSPSNTIPCAFFFYAIKNARLAKAGNCSLDEVGIHVLGHHLLCVELEHPTPYFLELLTEPLFFPIHKKSDLETPFWPKSEGDAYVCNGAYFLRKNSKEEYLLEKNPFYWNKDHISVPFISLKYRSSAEALDLFKRKEIDWVGGPFHVWDPSFESAKQEEIGEIQLNDRVYWCVLNTKSPFFENIKLRQALSLALDRQGITEEMQEGEPAFSPLPSHCAHYASTGTPKGDPLLAQKLFNEALSELKISRDQLPVFRFIYYKRRKREKIVQKAAEQWRRILGIEIQIDDYDIEESHQRFTTGQFEMALLGWSSPINHPLYLLNMFKLPCSEFNFCNWENAEYMHLLDLFLYELDPRQQQAYLGYAEAILIKEAPVIPLIYEKDRALKRKDLVIFLKETSIDFKHAFF